MGKVNPLVQPFVDNLHGNGRLRVWSLVVTILGDVVQPRGGRISMSDLLAITNHMNIGSGAIRTALSRLAKDGWVESKRRGRASSYAFGPAGRDGFGPASARIYAPVGRIEVSEWRVALLPELKAGERQKLRRELQETGALVAQSNFALWPVRAAPDVKMLERLDCAVFDGNTRSLPDWLRTELAPDSVAQAFNGFIEHYGPLARKTDRLFALEPLDALTLRILLIHDWRRLVLRHPRVPISLQPGDWPAEAAKKTVSSIYQSILPASEAFWNETCSPLGKATLEARFQPRG
ncbi:MAG: hypothetical protein GY947_21075 [Rhodobacteraceae bacterium]|nr:hypothetical protein [Paracoccaceae bacterium]